VQYESFQSFVEWSTPPQAVDAAEMAATAMNRLVRTIVVSSDLTTYLPLTDIGTAETTVGSNAPTFPAKQERH